MKTKDTNSEQELREAVYRWFHDNDIRIHVDKIEPLFELIQSEREKVLERVAKEVIGDNEPHDYTIKNRPEVIVRETALRIENQNYLREQQRQRLVKLAQKEESK